MAPQLLLDPEQNFAHTKQRVVEALQSHFPVRGAVQTLDIENVHVADNLPHDDVTAQHQAKVTGASWTVPVYGTAVIRDTATGEVKKKSKIRLMDLPKLTNRFSYIVDGQEYQLDHQWQLRPGAYTRRRDNGELETRFNTVGKPAFDMLFDPNKRTFHVEYGTSKVPLYPWLKAMGVSDQQMQASWGKDIYEANKNARGNDTALQRLFKSRTGKEATAEEAKKFLQDTLAQSKLDPQTTETTLGKGFTEVTGDALHLATEKLLKVHGGHPEDSRDALPFKKLRSAGDYIFDKIQAAAPATRLKVLRNLNSAATPGSLLQKGYFEAPLRSAFHTNAAARVAAQINPLDMLSGASSTTILGIGGIQSERAITQEAKMIDASHLGFLDPLHTPEGPRTGVSLRLPVSVVKDGDDVKIPLHNIHTNRTEYLTPAQVQKATVVFPDQVTWEGGKPKPIAAKVLAAAEGNEARHVHFGEAQYVMPHASQGYSITSNLVPFLSSNSGGRIGMADRHMEQAISLVHREVPLVQTGVGAWDAAHDTFEKAIGHQVAHTAPIDGTVKKITSTHILLQGKDGTEKKVHLYKNYPLNDAKSVLNSTPVVKEGDKVKAGQLISDTNYTRDGHLAIGTNLRTAYLPWHGYNFEDAVTISASAAKRLTSEHMSKPALGLTQETVLNKKSFQHHFPLLFPKTALEKLDDDGVVRVGQKVAPGEPLVLATSPYDLKDRTGITATSKWLRGAHNDNSLRWESEHPGEVVAVHRTPQGIQVHVRTQEPATVADKISFRHGNKGVIGQILPDHEMPKDKEGKPFEVLINPTSVGGRVNPGQLYTTVASKIAEKTGKPYVVNNFEPGVDYHAKVLKELKEHGLSDTEEVFDPKTGHSLGQVLTGKQYGLKLVHQVEKKSSVRTGMAGLPGLPSGEGSDSNLQPSRGGGTGGQAVGVLGVYALLAHGALHNLREMQTLKSESDDPETDPKKKWPSLHNQTWAALQTGAPIPTPKPTFAFDKFLSMLKGAGINTTKEGHSFIASPLTDKHILEMAGGRTLKDPTAMVWATKKVKGSEDLRPRDGGLFDEKLTGGHGGRMWSAIKLHEPIPNPVFEKPIRVLTGLKDQEFEDVLSGNRGVNLHTGALVDVTHKDAVTGGHAIKGLLDKIDVAKALPAAEQALQTAKGAELNKSLQRVQYLRALKKLDMSPAEAYVLNHVPVLPPVIRPITALPTGDLKVADVNFLYSKLAQTNNMLGDKTLQANWTEDRKAKLRKSLYENAKSLFGVGVTFESGKERGILQQISGTTPKTGFVQDTLANRRQDLTMRTTIVPGPQLGLDEVGIPEKHAMSLFQPFVVRQLVQQGSARSPLDAQKLIADKHPDTKAALEKVMAARPVLVKRDPVLHQYGIQGHMPKLVSGDAIQLHPLHTAGYNADHDGDTMAIFVPVTADAVAEAKRMLPSQHLISAASNKLMYVPSLEYAYGVYKLSQKGAETDKKFKTPGEILQAYHKGDLKHSDVVKLNDKATTAGRVLISTALPEDFRHDVLHSLDKPLDVKATGTLLTSVAKKHTADYDMYANRLKDLGAGAATGLVKLPLWAPEKADIFDAAAAKGMSGTNVKQMATQGIFQPRGMQVAAPATQHLIFKTPTLTLSLNDIAPDRGARDSVLRKTQAEVDGIYNRTDIDRAEKDRRAIQAWSRADEEMTKLHNTLQDIKQKTDPEAAGNLYNLYKAGVKPSGAQYKQFALAPMLMKDSRNRVIATPIQRSYSEGLSFGEFWTGMHGARRGAVMKVQEVQEPGALTKLLVNTSMDQLVSHHDCGTDQGLQLPASSPAAQDRYLAKPVTAGGKTYAAGTLLTPDVLSHLRTAAPATQLQVRSPVRCEHDKGVCQKCMGVRLLGQAPDLGTNVGIQAAQAIGERAVQLTLKEFHCMHEHSTVLVREAGNVYHTTLGRLFARGGNATTTADGEEVRTLLGVEVWDVDGWTVVKSARRHPQQHGTAMVLARTRSGFGILSQDNHPHMMRVNSAVCGSCGTYPKRDKGGRFRCRKCKFVWPKAPEAPDALQMVEPQEMGIKTHRAVLAQEPKATPAAAPLRSGWLAGMYCAEGFVLVRKEGEKKRPYVVGVGFGQNPGKLARRLGKEIKKEHGSLPGYTGKEFQLYSTEIGAAYQATFGRYSRNKGLPDGWGGLPACWLNDFVAGLFDGDGTFSSTEDSRWFTARIDTTSFLLAQQVQAILRDRGVHARIILTPRRKLSRHQGFGVTFPFTERAAGVLAASLKARKAKAKPVQNAERFADTVDYIRPVYFATPPLVYDLETASHTLYVGRVLTHNTGGVATGGSNAVNAFTRFQQLVNLPEKLPNASTLAMKAGTITKVDTDATGTRVTIDGTVHHVGKDAQGNSLAHAPAGAFSTPGYAHWTPPTVGMKVQAGQTLSDPNRTVVNPHDLLAATGSIRAVQNHLVDEIHGIYASEGVDRKHVEVLVRAMTGVAQVKDSHHPDFLRGDTYKTATIEAVNRELVAQNKKPIEYQPVLTGVAQLPHLNQGENWMGRLFHRNLRSVLSDAAALGHASDIHGTHPGPGVLYGAELGLNEKDSLKPGMAHLKNVPKWKY